MKNLRKCPFCGGKADPKGWVSLEAIGPECEDCGATARSDELWNSVYKEEQPDKDRP